MKFFRFLDINFFLTGYWWKGLDCNDRDAEVYPGRKPTNGDKRSDSNCNGIRGQDRFGQPLEEKFCANHPAKVFSSLKYRYI